MTEQGAKIYISGWDYVQNGLPILYDKNKKPKYTVYGTSLFPYNSSLGYFTYSESSSVPIFREYEGQAYQTTIRMNDGYYDVESRLRFYTVDGGRIKRAELPRSGFLPKVVTEVNLRPNTQSTNTIRINIPKLNVETGIWGVPEQGDGWDISWLGTNAGWLQNTTFPGSFEDKNSVITAHSYLSDGSPGPFLKLDTLSYGDMITISAFGEHYVYSVVDTKIVSANDMSVLEPVGYPCLTLMTCKGYNESNSFYDYRYIVLARLTDVY